MTNVKEIFRYEYNWNLSDDDILNSFNAANFYTFIMLPNSQSKETIQNHLPDFLHKFVNERASENSSLILQPLSSIHFGTDLQFDFPNRGNLKNNYILGAIAFFILFIACINFINISTAQSNRRAKEIGLRKVLGAHRVKIISQFITEFVMLTLIAVLFSVIIVALFLPIFNELTGQKTSLLMLMNLDTFFILISVWFLVVLVTCIYPAFYLSSFQPVETIKKSVGSGKTKRYFKKALIVFQFVISIFLIVVTFTIFKQHSFMKSHKLGFDKEQVLFISSNEEISKNYDVFKNILVQRTDIQNVSRANWVPSNPHNIENYSWIGKTGRQSDGFYSLFVEENYSQTLGFQLAAGRDFLKEYSTDKNASYIINETAAKKMGWTPQEAIGKTIDSYAHGSRQVIGVVKDFNITSLHQKIDPVIVSIGDPSQLYLIVVKIDSQNIDESLSAVNKLWKTLSPNSPFDYHFLDKDFENLYRTEERLSSIVSLFSGISILITCLGLLGLVIHSTRERTKEVGIRKVLGASSNGILFLLIKEYLLLILIAGIVAYPASYYFLNQWLQNFAYRIDISWWIFVLAGGIILVAPLATVIYQSLKTANTNPVESLRYE